MTPDDTTLENELFFLERGYVSVILPAGTRKAFSMACLSCGALTMDVAAHSAFHERLVRDV